MTLAVGISIAGLGDDDVDFVREAERLGVDAVWSAEFWAGDALTPLAYLAARTATIRLGTAIAQLGARTPAMLAMSAMSMQSLSSGRFVLGIGTSGPQVMQGWHGVSFDQPVRRTRETIEIIRMITAGERLVLRVSTIPRPIESSPMIAKGPIGISPPNSSAHIVVTHGIGSPRAHHAVAYVEWVCTTPPTSGMCL